MDQIEQIVKSACWVKKAFLHAITKDDDAIDFRFELYPDIEALKMIEDLLKGRKVKALSEKETIRTVSIKDLKFIDFLLKDKMQGIANEEQFVRESLEMIKKRYLKSLETSHK